MTLSLETGVMQRIETERVQRALLNNILKCQTFIFNLETRWSSEYQLEIFKMLLNG